MLTGILLGLLLLLALLAVPLTLRFQLNSVPGSESHVQLVWGFGLVRLTLHPTPSHPAEVIRKPKKRRTSRFNPLKALRQKPFRDRVFRFIRDIWQAIKKRELRLHLRLGLGDPAETGILWALLGPLSGLLANSRNVEIALEPDFLDQSLAYETSGDIRIVPLQLLYLLLALLLSPILWRGIRHARC